MRKFEFCSLEAVIMNHVRQLCCKPQLIHPCFSSENASCCLESFSWETIAVLSWVFRWHDLFLNIVLLCIHSRLPKKLFEQLNVPLQWINKESICWMVYCVECFACSLANQNIFAACNRSVFLQINIESLYFHSWLRILCLQKCLLFICFV